MDPVAVAGIAAEFCYNMQHAAVCGNQGIWPTAMTCAATRGRIVFVTLKLIAMLSMLLCYFQCNLISEIPAMLKRS